MTYLDRSIDSLINLYSFCLLAFFFDIPLGVILLTVVMGVLVVLTAMKNAKKEAAKQEKQW